MLVYELRHAEIASAGPPARTRESTFERYDPTTRCCGYTTLGHCLAGNYPGDGYLISFEIRFARVRLWRRHFGPHLHEDTILCAKPLAGVSHLLHHEAHKVDCSVNFIVRVLCLGHCCGTVLNVQVAHGVRAWSSLSSIGFVTLLGNEVVHGAPQWGHAHGRSLLWATIVGRSMLSACIGYD